MCGQNFCLVTVIKDQSKFNCDIYTNEETFLEQNTENHM